MSHPTFKQLTKSTNDELIAKSDKSTPLFKLRKANGEKDYP